MNGYTNQYLANTVNAASPEQLMLMLYDGAIRFLGQAILAIENQMIDKRAHFINKASAIISEFAATLDHDQNAQLAEDLDALYSYMLGRLQDGNLHNDAEPLEEVKKMLRELRQTWAQAIEINKQNSQQGVESTAPPLHSTQAYKSIATAM
ncbi:flagellar export chaperone FliS [Desulfogranum mediterraneum]|uniref:flagellar export chaperone FliS n=1 Tax=Desulfogranum mediterraneum TaxID=160661 RepID=UPI0004184604|nr:flagellar export chaperone FliS [Desulfogranum mediterraneum]